MKKQTLITPFDFNNHQVRIFPTEDGLSFCVVAKDVADALGYQTAKDATRTVPAQHKGRRSVPTLGGTQEMTVVDESGLYRIILRSDRPEAEPFMEWVTSEVLPAIRQTGGYKSGAEPMSKENRAELKRLFEAMKDRNEELQHQLDRAHKMILASNPKWEGLAKYYGMGLNATECAKLLDMAPRTAQKHLNLLKSAGAVAPIGGEAGELIGVMQRNAFSVEDKPVH